MQRVILTTTNRNDIAVIRQIRDIGRLARARSPSSMRGFPALDVSIRAMDLTTMPGNFAGAVPFLR